jgi:hypothetical protein
MISLKLNKYFIHKIVKQFNKKIQTIIIISIQINR